MRAFEYFQPTEIRFGRGRVGEIGEIVSHFGRRCLIVTVPPFAAVAVFIPAFKVTVLVVISIPANASRVTRPSNCVSPVPAC